MNIKIECDQASAALIARALEMYSRMGMGQFGSLGEHPTIARQLWEDRYTRFYDAAEELRRVYTDLPRGGYFGILEDKVGLDCKTAAHIYQQIRHELYLADKDPDKPKHTVLAHPADICQLAGIEEPHLTVTVDEPIR